MTYTVIYEKGPENWGAYVPDLAVPSPTSFAGSVEVNPSA
jgi:hypothetical protein